MSCVSVAHGPDLVGRDPRADSVLVLGVWRPAPPRGLTGRHLPQPRVAQASRLPDSGKADFETPVLTEVDTAMASGSWACCPTRLYVLVLHFLGHGSLSHAGACVCACSPSPRAHGVQAQKPEEPHARGCGVSAEHPGLWAPRQAPGPSPLAAPGARVPPSAGPVSGARPFTPGRPGRGPTLSRRSRCPVRQGPRDRACAPATCPRCRLCPHARLWPLSLQCTACFSSEGFSSCFLQQFILK